MKVIYSKDSDDFYVGSILKLLRSFTRGRTLDKSTERVKEAIKAYLGVQTVDKSDIEYVNM